MGQKNLQFIQNYKYFSKSLNNVSSIDERLSRSRIVKYLSIVSASVRVGLDCIVSGIPPLMF